MTKPLRAYDSSLGDVMHDDKTGENWCEDYCIEKELVQGLDVGSAEGCDQCGELVIEDSNGIMHTFKIVAIHQCLIPEDAYILLGDDIHQVWAVGR